MTATYVLQKDEKGQFSFILRTHGGQVLLTSAVYADKEIAMRRISAARQLAHNARNYEILAAQDGLPYFVVKNAKKEVIAQSEMYPDSESLRNGINLVKGKTRGAQLEDLTGTS